jgi:hypothetical protein
VGLGWPDRIAWGRTSGKKGVEPKKRCDSGEEGQSLREGSGGAEGRKTLNEQGRVAGWGGGWLPSWWSLYTKLGFMSVGGIVSRGSNSTWMHMLW